VKTLSLATAVALLVACSGAETSEPDGTGGDGAGAGPVAATTGTTPATTGATVGTGAGGLGPELCPADPGVVEGFAVGERLADVVVKDCAGNDVSLSAFCGAEALWIFAAHGWCPLCQSVSGAQESILDEYAGQGLVAINVVVKNGQSESPSADYCALWRETHGHQDVFTLYDPDGDILALWPGGSTSLSAFVDRNRIVRSKLEHESDQEAIRAEIEAALAP
jgi:hypothetical protein